MKKNEHQPHITRYQKYLYALLSVICCTVMVLNLIIPDSVRSEVENRPLAGFPALSISALQSGRYADQFEDYVSDQFLGRNTLFHVNYLFRRLCGQREIDDVYLGKNALLQNPSTPADDLLEGQIETINEFVNLTGLPASVLVAPSAANIQADKLPLDAPAADENGPLDQLYSSLNTSKADVRQVLKDHKDEYIYYRTDHHWTSLGAKYGAQVFLDSYGITMNPDDFENLKVSDTFEGTLANKTGSVGLCDDIYICPDKYQTEYLVTWNDGSKTTSIYNQEALDHKDQYQVFLGANQGLVHIETLSSSNENLLLFKDSYANDVIQYLLPYFRNIYVVDPRYFYEDINFVLAAGNITRLGFLFSYNNFVTDSSLRDVLQTRILQETADLTNETADDAASSEAAPEPEAENEEQSASSEQSQESQSASTSENDASSASKQDSTEDSAQSSVETETESETSDQTQNQDS